MTVHKPESEIDIPEVKRCPNCGEPIFLGELECSNCGEDVASLEQRIRSLNPTLVAGTGLLLGLMLTIAGLGEDGILGLILIVLGGSSMIGGGLFWGAMLFLNDPRRKRQ